MSVEQVKNVSKIKDLHDFTGIEKTQEGVDISEKMEGILGQVEKNVKNVAENKDAEVLSLTQERLEMCLSNCPDDDEDKKGILNLLSTALTN